MVPYDKGAGATGRWWRVSVANSNGERMTRDHSRRTFLKQASSLATAAALTNGLASAARAQPANASIDALAKTLEDKSWGQVVRPGAAGHAKITYYNARFDCVKGTTYFRPTTVEGVQKILQWANENRQTLAIRGAGHSFEGKSSHPDLVIDMSGMKRLDFDPKGTLEIEAGVLLGDVYTRLGAAEHVLPGGTCPTVGLVGHTLGGGIGDFLPMFGFAAQSLTAATLVTMSGQVLTVTDKGIAAAPGSSKPEAGITAPALMKALRGGGQGAFGVITTMTFKTHSVRGFKLASFKLDRANGLSLQSALAIVMAWQTWRTKLPKAQQNMVSAKLNLSRPGGGYEIDVSGLIAIPEQSSVTVAEIQRSLDPLFQRAEFRRKDFKPSLKASGAIRSFLDDNETSHNTLRQRLYGSSSALERALSEDAVRHLLQTLSSRIFVALYTSGGASVGGVETCLHPSEFIVEWTSYLSQRDAGAHKRIRDLRASVMQKAAMADHAFPNYPDDGARAYFTNTAALEDLKAKLDPAGISTSSLLAKRPQRWFGESCG